MAEGGDQDKDQKTEEPTSKKLQEAFEKGNVPFSRELGHFLMLFLLALIIANYSPGILRDTRNLLEHYILNVDTIAVDKTGVSIILRDLAFGGIMVLAVPLIGSVIVALAAGFLQNGIVISAESIKPKFSKISPVAGLKKIFSMRTLVEFIKNIVKISIVSIVAFMAVYPELSHLRELSNHSAEGILLFLAKLATQVATGVAIAMFFIALFDLVYQRLHHMKSLRMTKQEIKDEYKQSEGDPIIKQRLRALRQEKAKQRMMGQVPKSDVVITNPTHFAIALSYRPKEHKAPVVVAKGQDLIALKIKEVAEEHDIPVIQNPPLARALFASAELEEEIPLVHYEAVAKIISYVYKLKGRRM
ncbi:MAG: flagellar biosynthesis protein FlhB [Alphaproteobacteria bacterium]|nr:flagellar biosynthesis protein FlhB [Alphaproteobacteria bacterium]